MKILLNVARNFPDGQWIECEGFKLAEKNDGSFDLIITNELAGAKRQERTEHDSSKCRSCHEAYERATSEPQGEGDAAPTVDVE